MSTDGQEQGGIYAKRINAKNDVVRGVQVQGGDAQQAAAIIQAAQGIQPGKIVAEESIEAGGSVVGGVQYKADPADVEKLRRELASLRARIEQVIAAQELPDTDAEDTKSSLKVAKEELDKPQPDGSRVIRKLDEVNAILTKSSQAATTAGKIGAMVIKVAPYAAEILHFAHHLFGV